MDIRDGTIASKEELKKIIGEDYEKFVKQIEIKNIPENRINQFLATGKIKIKPNDTCPCGSGKKFKVCCWREK